MPYIVRDTLDNDRSFTAIQNQLKECNGCKKQGFAIAIGHLMKLLSKF